MYQDERARFKDWLKERQKHFDEVNASAADIAYFALRAGFPEIIVREWESHMRWVNTGHAT
jgi:hypothetical protein